jgi:pimeloyl-ACP methyl ester carboxylesterase
MATICLLHGNWHDGSCWEPLTGRLERLGHRVLTPELPLHDPTAGYAERARPAIEALASAEPPVAVVGHSLAAGIAPIVAAGTAAAIVIYLCPAPTGPFAGVDVEIAPLRRTFALPPTDENGASVWDPEAAVDTMYARLPRGIARAYAERLRPGSSAPDSYRPDGNPELPGRLILATEDEFFDPEWSRRIASAVLRTDPIEIAAGHFPMIEAPAELASLLNGLTHDAGANRRPDAS